MSAGSPGHGPADDAGPSKLTVLALLWAFTTLVWSIFTPPHLTFAARILLFQPLWGLRIYRDDLTWVQDLGLLLGVHAVYSYSIGAWRLLSVDDLWWLDFGDHVFLLYIQVFALLGLCGLFAGGIVFRGHQLKAANERDRPLFEDSIDEQLLPPLLIASRTTHSRMVPRRHAFSYSYLLVGIPVGVHGRISAALSVDSAARSWFHVDSADYLARSGQQHLGLGEKLKRYLHTQGVTDREYAFAYLVTAPRFLGYSFNPVSFWYLYDSNTKLTHMVLEVNNTFGERRMYLLRVSSTKGADQADGSSDGSSNESAQVVLMEHWEKDFHVSPFNSRNGSYSLKAVDPLATYQATGQVRIDNTIVLRSSADQAKIVARVWSEDQSDDATELSGLRLARFIASWWWVGLLTFPRIVWEAQKLFFRKKLHVWYRPEVAATGIGRPYTADELVLEPMFRAWLSHVVEHARQPLRLIYEPAHHDADEIILYSPGFTYEEAQQRTLTLQVLSPAFYSRFVHYAHAAEAFDRECVATDDKNRTLAIHGAATLPLLLEAMRLDAAARPPRPSTLALPDRWRWAALQRLRCPPPAPSYPGESHTTTTTSASTHRVSDIRHFAASELDNFARSASFSSSSSSSPPPSASAYRRCASKLFVAQRSALGAPALVALADRGLRAALLLAAMGAASAGDAGDVLRLRRWDAGDVLGFAGVLALANAVHLWSWLKG